MYVRNGISLGMAFLDLKKACPWLSSLDMSSPITGFILSLLEVNLPVAPMNLLVAPQHRM